MNNRTDNAYRYYYYYGSYPARRDEAARGCLSAMSI
jgi:hypothetical protein